MLGVVGDSGGTGAAERELNEGRSEIDILRRDGLNRITGEPDTSTLCADIVLHAHYTAKKFAGN